jgi:hypothetical protein
MSTQGAALSSNGSVEIRFNHDIVAYPKMDQMVALRSLNDGISIVSPTRTPTARRTSWWIPPP